MRINFKEVFLLVLFFVSYESQSLSMEGNDKNKSFYEKYIEEENQIETIMTSDRYAPLFFKIITKNNREIYILGSQHDIPPQLLLPPTVFKDIKSLCNDKHAILVTEHESIYEYNLKKLENIENINHDKNEWKIIEKTKEWIDIQDDFIDNEKKFKINDICKLDFTSGTNLLYAFSGIKMKEIGGGFESNLRQWGWKNTSYLESNDQLFEIEKKHPTDMSIFFEESVETYLLFKKRKKLIDKKVENEEEKNKLSTKMSYITLNVLKGIENYKYENYLSSDKVLPSCIERNEEWAKTVKLFLNKHENSNAPILIVCGAAHLKGMLNKNSKSFLALLVEELGLEDHHVQRMHLKNTLGHEGEWGSM